MSALLEAEAPAAQGSAGARTPGAYGTELRRGLGPGIGALVAGTLLVLMFLDDRGSYWQGTWIFTTDQLRNFGLLVCGPIAIAGGCWLGGRERRRGTDELRASMSRTELRQTLLACAPASFWPAAGYLLAAAICLLVTLPDAVAGHPFLLMTAADAMAFASLGAVGFVAGRVLRWRLAGVVLAAGAYVAMGLSVYGEGSAARWLGPAKRHFGLWEEPVWWAGPVQMLWTGGIAATLLLLLAARRRVLAVIPFAAAVLAATLLVQTGEKIWQPNNSFAALVCTQVSPQVCVTRLHSSLLPEIAAEVRAVHAKIDGIPQTPGRYAEAPFAEAADSAPDGESQLPLPEFGMTPDDGRLSLPDDYRGWVAHYAAWPRCGRNQIALPLSSQALVEWLSGMADPTVHYMGGRPPSIHRKAEKLRVMPEADRTAVLADYFAAIAECKPNRVNRP